MALHDASVEEDGEKLAATNAPFATSNHLLLGNASPSSHGAVSGEYAELVATGEPSIYTTDEDSPWAQKTVLSLDGGRVRGLSSLLILKEIMQEVEKLERECTPAAYSSEESPLMLRTSRSDKKVRVKYPKNAYLPCHYFDYIAGSSTGGLIAIMLGRQRATVDAAILMYQQLAEKVFEKAPSFLRQLSPTYGNKYRRHELTRLLLKVSPSVESSEDESSSDFESDSIRCRTMVCALSSSPKRDTRTPYLFRSYPPPEKTTAFERNPSHNATYQITQVACAIFAAPKHSKSYKIGDNRFYDAAAMGLNNPSWEIWNEVTRLHSGTFNAVDVLLSLGSGTIQGKDLKKGGIMSRKLSSHMTLLKDVSDVVHEKVQIESAKGLKYFRFEVDSGLAEVKLDEWKSGTFDRIVAATQAYVKRRDISENISACAKSLVKRRRARAQTLQWEGFALGTRYRCPISSCEYAKGGGNTPFEDRNELADHLQIHHNKPPPDPTNGIELLLDQGRTSSW